MVFSFNDVLFVFAKKAYKMLFLLYKKYILNRKVFKMTNICKNLGRTLENWDFFAAPILLRCHQDE
jgi:hypothetical protein